MPADFDACVKKGGKVRTINVNDSQYMHVCYIGGKSHHGEVLHKAKASEDPLMQGQPIENAPELASAAGVEQATAALKFEKVEITSDGTREGTTIKVNGKEIKNLSCLDFCFYDSSFMPISLRYTIREKDVKPGELGSYVNYSLNPPAPATATDKATASEAAPAVEASLASEPADADLLLIDHEQAIASIEEEKKNNPWAQIGTYSMAAKLSTKTRNNLKTSDFAVPETREYPIHDETHARDALSRVANKSPALQKRVRDAVHRKFPGIKIGGKDGDKKKAKASTNPYAQI